MVVLLSAIFFASFDKLRTTAKRCRCNQGYIVRLVHIKPLIAVKTKVHKPDGNEKPGSRIYFGRGFVMNSRTEALKKAQVLLFKKRNIKMYVCLSPRIFGTSVKD